MTKEKAEEFLNKLEQDPSFKKRLQEAKSQEEVKAIFEENNISFTKEEYMEAYKKHTGRELNPEELAQVAAGAPAPIIGILLKFA